MKNEILDLEKKYWKGMENHDYDTVKSLTHFPCIVAGKDGIRSVDESSFLKMFESSESNEIKLLNIYDEETQMIHEDTVVIAYLIELEYTIDGKKTPMKCACTTTWVLESGKWLAAMHTESDLKN